MQKSINLQTLTLRILLALFIFIIHSSIWREYINKIQNCIEIRRFSLKATFIGKVFISSTFQLFYSIYIIKYIK